MSVLQKCNSMPQLNTLLNSIPVSAAAFQFRYKSAGKCRRQFLSLGDECFKNVCTKGHKVVTTTTSMALVVHALKEHDLVARIHFCNWFHQSAHNGEVYPQLMFFYDEAWFSLHGEVNFKNSHWWSTENPTYS